ncbi:hypothetical protein C1645_876267 [Glomus cerebriforme]|uniref:Uncharacterized protein n=1 Tax=Glomus cerebriforme TaxID=658196 RepID=A0A397T4X8_9GLOM|nr:hypothetical protein C1645_876267 [Glomus cerebriforme]
MQNLNFLNLNIWYIAFFSFIPLVPASIASYVDNSYSSNQDLYDALLNTFFPISFVILFDISGESGPIKNVLLPLLDDVLYNAITWMIPLIVSFSYDDLSSIKIFSIINMCLHVIFAVYAICKWKILDVARFKATSTVIIQRKLKDAFREIEKIEADETDIEKGDKMKKSIDETEIERVTK